jgi:acyl carrier protein
MDTSATLHPRLVEILADHLSMDPGEIGPDATLEQLGIDSLDRVALLIDIETDFNIDIPLADELALNTVADLARCVASLASISPIPSNQTTPCPTSTSP